MVSETQKFSGLGTDSMLKNVKCKEIYEAIRLTLLFFFFCSSAKASLGILRVLNIGTKLLRKMFLTTCEKKKKLKNNQIKCF